MKRKFAKNPQKSDETKSVNSLFAKLPTYALVIGVSNTQLPQFDSLPAANADATLMAKSLAKWGVPEENINLLLDPGEKDLKGTLNQLKTLPGPFHFLFYFCGHGDRRLILSDSAVGLERLLDQLYELQATSFYLFIDACHLRLDSVLNPNSFDSCRTLFCLLSSGIFPSFENANLGYGYFTKALVKGLGILGELGCSAEKLVRFIQKELASNNLPLPEMYNIGTNTIDIFQAVESCPLKKAISAVYSCGIFIDKVLFCDVFKIETDQLENLGLLIHRKGSWHPHESLIELAETEALPLEPQLAKLYWAKQFEDRPGHFESALHFVLTLQCFGHEIKFDPLLIKAYQILASETVLHKCVDFYSDHLSPSAEYLAAILIEKRQFSLAAPLLQSRSSTRLHFLWKTGAFLECIQEASEKIDSIDSCLHRAAAHYFLGHWEEAKRDFLFIERRSKSPRIVARAQCLLGTIDGIRGIEVKKNCSSIESAVRFLLKKGDLAGAWVGWNNLGEIMWKAGELKASERYLLNALELAENDSALLLETLRNFLQLELRKPDPSREKLIELISRLEPILERPLLPCETMQVYNTLCTAAHFLNNMNLAEKHLKIAIPLTAPSKEYHIYTLSNMALLHGSALHLEQAISLAKEGRNLFAIEQIRQDHKRYSLTSEAPPEKGGRRIDRFFD